MERNTPCSCCSVDCRILFDLPSGSQEVLIEADLRENEENRSPQSPRRNVAGTGSTNNAVSPDSTTTMLSHASTPVTEYSICERRASRLIIFC